MALQKCHDCGNQVSKDAQKCPQCGAVPKTPANMVSAVIALVSAGAFVWFYFGGGVERQAQNDMKKITQQVARDARDEYNIAKKSGNPIDACVHAGMVSAAYLQAKDEQSYDTWKRIERADCEAAGMPKP